MTSHLKSLAITTGISFLGGYGTYRAYQFGTVSSKDKMCKKLQTYPQKAKKVKNSQDMYLSTIERTNCMGLRNVKGSWSKVEKCENLKSDLLSHRFKTLEKKTREIATLPNSLERIAALHGISSDGIDHFAVSAKRAKDLMVSSQYKPDLLKCGKKALDVATDLKTLIEKIEYHLGEETFHFITTEKRSAAEIADALKLLPEQKLQFVTYVEKVISDHPVENDA